MSVQGYYVPGQTEGRMKAFLEWKSIDLSYHLSLISGGNVSYYESVHHLIPTHENREHHGNFQNRSYWFSSAFNWVSMYILFLAKLKGRGAPFFEGCTWEHLVFMRDEKVPTFLKFEIILPLLCFLLDSLTNQHCRSWSSMISLWIDSRTYKK